MLRRRACREAREKGVGEERSQAKQTNSLRVRQPRGLEFRCGPAPVRREREGESVLNNLVQTGYHTTNQTDRHAKPHKTGKDHNPDREKLRPGASSPCTAQHTCTPPSTPAHEAQVLVGAHAKDVCGTPRLGPPHRPLQLIHGDRGVVVVRRGPCRGVVPKFTLEVYASSSGGAEHRLSILGFY